MVSIGALLADPQYSEKLILQKLFCVYASCSREDFWRRMDEDMDSHLQKKILDAYDMYVRYKKPLEYLLGYVEFFGKQFLVNEATLIPRPETEYMVNAVGEYLQQQKINNKEQKNILLDIGTGCGVLGISILLQYGNCFSEVVFTDYFQDALEVAKKNYELLVTNYTGKVDFVHANLLDFLIYGNNELFYDNIIFVANLPYIPEEVFETHVADNVKNWEPKSAFVGGVDGLKYYRNMFTQIFSLFEKGKIVGKSGFILFLEMMTWQIDILRREFGDKVIFEEVKTFHFNIRIVKAYFK